MPNSKRVRLSPSPANTNLLHRWLAELRARVGEGPFMVQGYSVGSLPDATQWGDLSDPYSSIIFVYDESGGPVLAFSDGTDWRRVTDRAIVT